MLFRSGVATDQHEVLGAGAPQGGRLLTGVPVVRRPDAAGGHRRVTAGVSIGSFMTFLVMQRYMYSRPVANHLGAMHDEMLIDDCSFRFDEPNEESHRDGVCTGCVGRIRVPSWTGWVAGLARRGRKNICSPGPLQGLESQG